MEIACKQIWLSAPEANGEELKTQFLIVENIFYRKFLLDFQTIIYLWCSKKFIWEH